MINMRKIFISLGLCFVFWCLIYFVVIFSPSSSYINIVTPLSIKLPEEITPYITTISFQNLLRINQFFDDKYTVEIFPKGKQNIERELLKINQISDDNSKLDEIFRWQMDDWLNPDWDQDARWTTNEKIFYFNNQGLDSPNLKAMPKRDFEFTFYSPKNADDIFYGNDPYWLAYNKFGGCREISTLFAYMANNAGIESRTVQTGVWHQWAEVKINGEWMYYDPWCARAHGYYNPNDGNLTYKSKWFNKIEFFEENCHSYAYINFYNDIIPNPVATQTYSYSALFHYVKNAFISITLSLYPIH